MFIEGKKDSPFLGQSREPLNIVSLSLWRTQHFYALWGQPIDLNKNSEMLYFPCGGAAG